MTDQELRHILEEIKEMKQLLMKVYSEEQRIEAEEGVIEEEARKIEAEEEEIGAKQEKLLGGLSALKFANIQAWKGMIWNNCEEKRSYQQGREIDYRCTLLSGPCRFENCPKNKQEEHL